MYDITRSLSPETAVWPGDESVRFLWTSRISQGASVNVGKIVASTHAGTHVDAPLHYMDGGESSDQFELDAFLGPAVVVDVGELPAVGLNQVRGIGEPIRVLFKSVCSELTDTDFPPHFPHVLPSVIHDLAGRGCRLVGTDAPSVDPVDSTDLPTHRALAETGIVNLENLCLRGIEPGRYRLIALPMKLRGMDAAPVRALLIEE